MSIEQNEIREMYDMAFGLATELTKDQPKLFKTVFQCIFWEGCHYLFRLKLRSHK